MLTFVYRHFDGSVPVPGALDSGSQALLNTARDTLNTVDGLLYRCRFKEAIRTNMSLAQGANRYLDEKSPWKIIKQNKEAAGTALYVVIAVLSALRIVMYPFLPFSSQKLHEYLGFEGNVQDSDWQLTLPKPGQKLRLPEPLFPKLDEKLVEEEAGRLGHVPQ